ncbi:thionin-like protein 2 [Quercus suber]|uniref:Thionin-like protein 2 n=1 Tax=Quercus suber TaxID=58331 RepID=A0AAW0KXK6_QUESU
MKEALTLYLSIVCHSQKSWVTCDALFALGDACRAITASFQDCYSGCFILCFIQTRNTLQCGFKCIKDCITPPSTGINSQYFCELGCATYSCSNISTIGNPDGKKVADCVDGCSKPCAKN